MEVLIIRKSGYGPIRHHIKKLQKSAFLCNSMQLAAVDLVQPSHVAKEKLALQKHFKTKRDHVLKRLKELGFEVDIPPCSTFYIWLNLVNLPAPINNGLVRFVFRFQLDGVSSSVADDDIAIMRRFSLKNSLRSRRSSSLVFSSILILLTDATCSTLRATTSCVFLSDLPSRTLIKASCNISFLPFT